MRTTSLVLFVILIFQLKLSLSFHLSYQGGQQGPSARFVHFTKLVSASSNVDFSPLYGSLRISQDGLYSLSYSLQASDNSKYEESVGHDLLH